MACPIHETSTRPIDFTELTDHALIAHVDRLVGQERALTVRFLDHLNEIARRRLHLELGYGSLFDYCVRRLRYSESAANRRIRTARCLKEYPRARELLLQGKANLNSLSKISRVLTRENSAELLERASDKSCREVDAIVESLRPGPAVRDRLEPIAVRRTASGAPLPGLAPSPRTTDGMPSPHSAGRVHSPRPADPAPAPHATGRDPSPRPAPTNSRPPYLDSSVKLRADRGGGGDPTAAVSAASSMESSVSGP